MITSIRILCPVCDTPLSVSIDDSDVRNLRVPCGAVASVVRAHADAAHPEPDRVSATVTINIQGSALDERELRRAVEREIRRDPGSSNRLR